MAPSPNKSSKVPNPHRFVQGQKKWYTKYNILWNIQVVFYDLFSIFSRADNYFKKTNLMDLRLISYCLLVVIIANVLGAPYFSATFSCYPHIQEPT